MADETERIDGAEEQVPTKGVSFWDGKETPNEAASKKDHSWKNPILLLLTFTALVPLYILGNIILDKVLTTTLLSGAKGLESIDNKYRLDNYAEEASELSGDELLEFKKECIKLLARGELQQPGELESLVSPDKREELRPLLEHVWDVIDIIGDGLRDGTFEKGGVIKNSSDIVITIDEQEVVIENIVTSLMIQTYLDKDNFPFERPDWLKKGEQEATQPMNPDELLEVPAQRDRQGGWAQDIKTDDRQHQR